MWGKEMDMQHYEHTICKNTANNSDMQILTYKMAHNDFRKLCCFMCLRIACRISEAAKCRNIARK